MNQSIYLIDTAFHIIKINMWNWQGTIHKINPWSRSIKGWKMMSAYHGKERNILKEGALCVWAITSILYNLCSLVVPGVSNHSLSNNRVYSHTDPTNDLNESTTSQWVSLIYLESFWNTLFYFPVGKCSFAFCCLDHSLHTSWEL